MIYHFGRLVVEALHIIRHWGRAFFCKEYYVNHHGVPKCNKIECHCEWYWCPKRRGVEE